MPVRSAKSSRMNRKPGKGANCARRASLEAHFVVVIEVVDTDHLMAVSAEPLHQMKADKTSGACDQILHGNTFNSLGISPIRGCRQGLNSVFSI